MMAVQNISVRNRGRWRRRAAVVVAALALTSACATGTGPAPGDLPSRSVAHTATAGSAAPGFDSATRDDAEFNRQFRHEFADVDGLRMHYVTGGTGPPLVLLHGWPQSWYAWRGVMPALATQYTVYALDLPGLGDSDGAPLSYDKATSPAMSMA
jgi:alpha/beta hydrolase fold